MDVILDIPGLSDRRFTYGLPGGGILPYGAKVRVPFGFGNRDGFVVGAPNEPPGLAVKDVEYAYDLRFLPGSSMLRFAAVLAQHHCTSLASTLSLLWPPVAPRLGAGVRYDGDSGPRLGEAGGLSCPEEQDLPGNPRLVWGARAFRWACYRRVVEEQLCRGKGILVLVPEIKDVLKAEREISPVAGDRLVTFYSRLTGLQRRQAWLEAAEGCPRVVLGTRSALFASIPALGAIVVDEEWSDSYKSPENPFYHARTVARLRALHEGCSLLYGASQPSVSLYRSLQTGDTTAIRDKDCDSPTEVDVVDLREGGARRQAISPRLKNVLEETFSRGENAFLFLNRRGESTQITCQDCGNTLVCPGCGSFLSYHSKDRTVWCHTCNYVVQAPERCQECGGHRWRFLGFGIQKAEKEFQKKFPEIPLFRLDRDSLRSGGKNDLLKAFGDNSPACLLGTQMAFGFRPLPRIGTVGVLSLDTVLHLPDFTASERVFHLLWDLLSLSDKGRGQRVGRLVVQTYNPGHHALKGISDSEYFYRTELQNRELVGYPPFKELFKVRFSGKNENRVKESSRAFAKMCLGAGSELDVLGPVPSPKPRIRGVYRWQVALRGEGHRRLAEVYLQSLKAIVPGTGVKVSVDVDPVDAS